MITNNKIVVSFLINVLFRLVASTSDCTNEIKINNSEGVITSPNYPNSYPNSTSCTWHIIIPKNSILSINIVDVNIQADDPQKCPRRAGDGHCCIHNWLSVPIVTPFSNTKLICGHNVIPSFVLTDSFKVGSIKFHSSKNLGGYNGFKLKYALAPSGQCKKGQFRCRDGEQCLNALKVCDGLNDCRDKSDETGCSSDCKERGLSNCPDLTNVCYNESLSVCATSRSCPSGGDWAMCDDGILCYNKSYACDKIVNCIDQSDESRCDTPDVYYMCDNWKMIAPIKVCDGADDCGDRSDEEGCVRPSLETAIILGCLSCSLLFILLASYTFHAHHQHSRHQLRQTDLSQPRIRPILNINSHSYIMPFREPPPPYPFDPPPNRRRFRRPRRHRSASTPVNMPGPAEPVDEQSESSNQEQAANCAWKEPEEQQECSTSTD